MDLLSGQIRIKPVETVKYDCLCWIPFIYVYFSFNFKQILFIKDIYLNYVILGRWHAITYVLLRI